MSHTMASTLASDVSPADDAGTPFPDDDPRGRGSPSPERFISDLELQERGSDEHGSPMESDDDGIPPYQRPTMSQQQQQLLHWSRAQAQMLVPSITVDRSMFPVPAQVTANPAQVRPMGARSSLSGAMVSSASRHPRGAAIHSRAGQPAVAPTAPTAVPPLSVASVSITGNRIGVPSSQRPGKPTSASRTAGTNASGRKPTMVAGVDASPQQTQQPPPNASPLPANRSPYVHATNPAPLSSAISVGAPAAAAATGPTATHGSKKPERRPSGTNPSTSTRAALAVARTNSIDEATEVLTGSPAAPAAATVHVNAVGASNASVATGSPAHAQVRPDRVGSTRGLRAPRISAADALQM
jgi:hypothetical protein